MSEQTNTLSRQMSKQKANRKETTKTDFKINKQTETYVRIHIQTENADARIYKQNEQAGIRASEQTELAEGRDKTSTLIRQTEQANVR